MAPCITSAQTAACGGRRAGDASCVGCVGISVHGISVSIGRRRDHVYCREVAALLVGLRSSLPRDMLVVVGCEWGRENEPCAALRSASACWVMGCGQAQQHAWRGRPPEGWRVASSERLARLAGSCMNGPCSDWLCVRRWSCLREPNRAEGCGQAAACRN